MQNRLWCLVGRSNWLYREFPSSLILIFLQKPKLAVLCKSRKTNFVKKTPFPLIRPFYSILWIIREKNSYRILSFLITCVIVFRWVCMRKQFVDDPNLLWGINLHIYRKKIIYLSACLIHKFPSGEVNHHRFLHLRRWLLSFWVGVVRNRYPFLQSAAPIASWYHWIL